MKKKYAFELCYELDIPFAVAVVTYLDCEHYQYLHKSLSKEVRIINVSKNSFQHLEVMKVFGLNFGQIYTVEYTAPGNFRQLDFKPLGKFNLFSFMELETVLNYFPTGRNTTLSELTIKLTLPFWLYPFRKLIKFILKRVKINKDLEDLGMINRRGRLFGRENISSYFKKGQFFLFKEDFSKFFGPNSEFLGTPDPKYLNQKWTDIKNYV